MVDEHLVELDDVFTHLKLPKEHNLVNDRVFLCLVGAGREGVGLHGVVDTLFAVVGLPSLKDLPAMVDDCLSALAYAL